MPSPFSRRLRRLIRPAWLGTLRRLTPISSRWGEDRGTPLDRYYIERFLEANRHDIRGRVLEIKDSAYTQRFGSGVTVSDVLDVYTANPHATIVADLASAEGVPSDSYDCIILVQTLQFVRDLQAALYHVHRMLRPGGVLLATVPCLSRVVRKFDYLRDHWRFTDSICAELFGDRFGPSQISVRLRGNVLTSIAFLTGMAHEELSRRELEHDDPDFPLLVTIRAVKSGSSAPAERSGGRPTG